MTCAVMRTSQGSTISRPQIKKRPLLPSRTIRIDGVCYQWSQTAFHDGQSTTVEPISFMRGVHSTGVSNCQILGRISLPSVKKLIKGSFNTYRMQITSSKTVTYLMFVSKNVKIGYRSFHPSGVFPVAPVVDNKQSVWRHSGGGGGCLMRY